MNRLKRWRERLYRLLMLMVGVQLLAACAHEPVGGRAATGSVAPWGVISPQAEPAPLGRVADIQGAAQVWDAQARHWTPLQAHRMLAAGDRIRSDRQSLVEVQFGASQLFIGPDSELEWPVLNPALVQLNLLRGAMMLRTGQHSLAPIEIVTTEVRLRPLSEGLFRVDRDAEPGGRTAMLAWRGQFQWLRPEGTLVISPGHRHEASDHGVQMQALTAPLTLDPLSTWVIALDQAQAARQTPVPDSGVVVVTRPWGWQARWDLHPHRGWIWQPLPAPLGWTSFHHHRPGRWDPGPPHGGSRQTPIQRDREVDRPHGTRSPDEVRSVRTPRWDARSGAGLEAGSSSSTGAPAGTPGSAGPRQGPDRHERFERPGRAERPDRPDKPDRPYRPERPERPERPRSMAQ